MGLKNVWRRAAALLVSLGLWTSLVISVFFLTPNSNVIVLFQQQTQDQSRFLDTSRNENTLPDEIPERVKGESPTKRATRTENKGGEVTSSSAQYTKPLDYFVDTESQVVKNDVQELLSFAVIGHPKCATTFLLKGWLGIHPEISMPDEETVVHAKSAVYDIVHHIHALDPAKPFHAYKNPNHVFNPDALAVFQDHFPRAKLIIGLRHPVTWFESFLNHWLRNGVKLPDLHEMMGRCTTAMHQLCLDHARFHYNLAMLGKTNMSGPEMELFHYGDVLTRELRVPNKVFLYETSQFYESSEEEKISLEKDLRSFLGLTEPLLPLQQFSPDSSYKEFDICSPRYIQLRNSLLQAGNDASEWIIRYFLPHEDVFASSQSRFVQYLQKWKVDPCGTDTTLGKHDFKKIAHAIDSDRPVDVQPLLDFVNIGFPKCATSHFGRWMDAHQVVSMLPDESMGGKNIPSLSKHLLNLPNTTLHGLKRTSYIYRRVEMQSLQNFFPQSKLVLGVRHPVRWFESYYNYRVREGQKLNFTMPSPETLINKCAKNVCVESSRFHYFIAQLGKTALSTSRELGCFRHGKFVSWNLRLPNNVFIYDSDQFDDESDAVRETLRVDLESFLGLSSPLKELSSGAREKNSKSFDICELQYEPLRKVLVDIGGDAASWILDYFIEAPGVTVSSKENFALHLRAWSIDPCPEASGPQSRVQTSV